MGNPYKQSRTIKFLPSFVCYADILGYSQLCKEAFDSNTSLDFLKRLKRALTREYKSIREFGKEWDQTSDHAVKVFTDNIVVGYPDQGSPIMYGQAELTHLLLIFSEMQLSLAMEGFFLRGGIAFGDFYMDDDVVFGKPLLEAYEQDVHGGPPRMIIAQSALEMLCLQGDPPRDWEYAPMNNILQDSDGKFFLHYLYKAFNKNPYWQKFRGAIGGHRQQILNNLCKFADVPGVKAKYEWAANYHDFACQEVIDENPSCYDSDGVPFPGMSVPDAQKIFPHNKDIENKAPKRIDTKILSENLSPSSLRSKKRGLFGPK